MDSNTLRAATQLGDPIDQVAYLCDQFFAFSDQEPDLSQSIVQELYWESYFALEAIYERDHLDVIFMGPMGYDVDPARPEVCYEFIKRTFKHTRGLLAPVLRHRAIRERFESKRAEIHAHFGAGLPSKKLHTDVHPTLELLHDRAGMMLAQNDYAGVVHACASMLELHAKIVCADQSLMHKSLGTFIDTYRRRSQLHSELLDYIAQVFKMRNRTPGAGHGIPDEPTVDRATAVMLIEFCVALVRIEHQLINEI